MIIYRDAVVVSHIEIVVYRIEGYAKRIIEVWEASRRSDLVSVLVLDCDGIGTAATRDRCHIEVSI